MIQQSQYPKEFTAGSQKDRQIPYDPTYMGYLRLSDSQKHKIELVVTRNCEERQKGNGWFMSIEFQICKMKMFLRSVSQQYKYT